ncbi:MAG: hypothetical protein ACLU62_01110 [Hydrogeniiclostridium sp.]
MKKTIAILVGFFIIVSSSIFSGCSRLDSLSNLEARESRNSPHDTAESNFETGSSQREYSQSSDSEEEKEESGGYVSNKDQLQDSSIASSAASSVGLDPSLDYEVMTTGNLVLALDALNDEWKKENFTEGGSAHAFINKNDAILVLYSPSDTARSGDEEQEIKEFLSLAYVIADDFAVYAEAGSSIYIELTGNSGIGLMITELDGKVTTVLTAESDDSFYNILLKSVYDEVFEEYSFMGM